MLTHFCCVRKYQNPSLRSLGSSPNSWHAAKSHSNIGGSRKTKVMAKTKGRSNGSKTQWAHHIHDGQQSSTMWRKPCAECAKKARSNPRPDLECKTHWAHYFQDVQEKTELAGGFNPSEKY